MMKKLLLLLTVAIAMLALPLAAHADKTKWTNPNYDFNKLHRINLVSISVVDPVGSNFTVDDMATEKIISALPFKLTKAQNRASPLTKNRVPDITKKRSKTIKETGSNGTQNELFMNMFRPALYMTATLM